MLKKANGKLEQQNNSNTENIKPKPAVSKQKSIFSFKALFTFVVILILSFIVVFTNKRMDGIYIKNYLGLFTDFIFTPSSKVKFTENKINILILGKSGEGYTAPDLTDTIIFSSVVLDNPSIRLISIPRDLWIPEIRAKLNSAYYWGKEKDSDGILLSKNLVENVLGQEIHYVVVFDFSSFIKIIDVLGGVEVNVEKDFIDEKYPIVGKENDLCGGDRTYKCRYETIKFEEGIQLMDGKTALKFVRSRNAQGDEGTDIAREQRQQKIIVAVKNRILSTETLLNPKKIWKVWNVLKESVETNFDESSAVITARRLFDSKDLIKSSIIPGDLLTNPSVSPKYDNQYVFVPKDGSWLEINNWVKSFLD